MNAKVTKPARRLMFLARCARLAFRGF